MKKKLSDKKQCFLGLAPLRELLLFRVCPPDNSLFLELEEVFKERNPPEWETHRVTPFFKGHGDSRLPLGRVKVPFRLGKRPPMLNLQKWPMCRTPNAAHQKMFTEKGLNGIRFRIPGISGADFVEGSL